MQAEVRRRAWEYGVEVQEFGTIWSLCVNHVFRQKNVGARDDSGYLGTDGIHMAEQDIE